MANGITKYRGSERIMFNMGDAEVRGKLYLPEVDKNKGLILFVHGLGYCTRAYEMDIDRFAAEGWYTLSFDMRGHLLSRGTFTMEGAAKDISKIIDSVSQRYSLGGGGGEVGILAHSTGGLVSLMAAKQDNRIKYMSIVSLVTSTQDSFDHWFDSGFIRTVIKGYEDGYEKEGKSIPRGLLSMFQDRGSLIKWRDGKIQREILDYPGWYGTIRVANTGQFFDEISNCYDILQNTSDVKIPVLLFHGKTDEVIPAYKSRQLFESINIPGKKLIETEATDHFFTGYWDIVIDETLKFFQERNNLLNGGKNG